jgi:hypothetical protein
MRAEPGVAGAGRDTGGRHRGRLPAVSADDRVYPTIDTGFCSSWPVGLPTYRAPRRVCYAALVPAWDRLRQPMNPQQLAARIRRLESLAMGLRREHQAAGNNGALTLEERSEYLEALRRATSALEAARVPAERALQRHPCAPRIASQSGPRCSNSSPGRPVACMTHLDSGTWKALAQRCRISRSAAVMTDTRDNRGRCGGRTAGRSRERWQGTRRRSRRRPRPASRYRCGGPSPRPWARPPASGCPESPPRDSGRQRGSPRAPVASG